MSSLVVEEIKKVLIRCWVMNDKDWDINYERRREERIDRKLMIVRK